MKEIFRDEKYIIIVMEYFDGGDLLAYVNTVLLDVNQKMSSSSLLLLSYFLHFSQLLIS